MVISAAMTLDTEGGSCMKEQKRDLEREGQILLPSHIRTSGQLLYKLGRIVGLPVTERHKYVFDAGWTRL